MRRTTIGLWVIGGIVLASGITVFGGWLALRKWPAEVGPRLPPSLAYAIADWGPLEASAAHTCFGGNESYWNDHPMTPAQEDARNAVLCAELRGARDRQLAVLAFINERHFRGTHERFVPSSPERDALVFGLTSSPDRELREMAHECWRNDGPRRFDVFRRLSESGYKDLSRLSPDGWVPGPVGTIAWHMLIGLSWGFDHETPSKFRNHLRKNLTQLIDLLRSDESLQIDPRDRAVALLAITEAYGLANDKELKPVVERERDALLADPLRLQRLWQEDTTTAVLTARVYRMLLAVGLASSDMQTSLSAGIDGWWTGNFAAEPPAWVSQGRPVHATIAERWGALMVSLESLNRIPTQQPFFPENSPEWIADPGDSTPVGRYLIRLSGFIPPGKKWDLAFKKRRQALLASELITPDHQPPEGFWPETATVSGTWETVFALLEISIYRRYNPPTP